MDNNNSGFMNFPSSVLPVMHDHRQQASSSNYISLPNNELNFQENNEFYRQPAQRFPSEDNVISICRNNLSGTSMLRTPYQQPCIFGVTNGNIDQTQLSNFPYNPSYGNTNTNYDNQQHSYSGNFSISDSNYQFSDRQKSSYEPSREYSGYTSHPQPTQNVTNTRNHVAFNNYQGDSFNPNFEYNSPFMQPSIENNNFQFLNKMNTEVRSSNTSQQFQRGHLDLLDNGCTTQHPNQTQAPPPRIFGSNATPSRHSIFNQPSQSQNALAHNKSIKQPSHLQPNKTQNSQTQKNPFKPKLLSVNLPFAVTPKERKIDMLAKLSPDLDSLGTHVFSLPLSKLSQTANRFPKRLIANFEIIGQLAEEVVPFVHISGFRFSLVDGQQVQACVFYDMDDVRPQLSPGSLYRCVGRYQQRQGLFQSFIISKCNEEDKKMLKVFEMHSEKLLTELIQGSSIKEK